MDHLSATAVAEKMPRKHRPLVRCFNVKYSPNLGDGLLSECLERELIALGADPRSDSIDLAARKAYGDAMMGRDTVMKILDALPGPLRRLAVRAPLKINAERKWRPHFVERLADAQGVVIGGGNLISDLDLNFPTKLGLAIEEAGRRNLPTVIYASGVASGWSATGLRMFRDTFSRPNLRAVFVRDNDSKKLWDELLAKHTGHTAQVVRDPGLLASELYPAQPKATGKRPVAGLGIMSHIAIRYHAERAPDATHLNDWYVGVARRLIAEGFQVGVFTNGSPEDKVYAAALHDRLRSLGSETEITFLTQSDPAGLCAHIAGFDVLIAYRMHAIIAAYSYGVPAIALAWDRKLRAFMASVQREDYLMDVASTEPEACVAAAIGAVQRGIGEQERAKVIAEARADVAKAWDAMGLGQAA